MISVIIPTYNRNDLLFGRALPSVFAQTHQPAEIHIVADGMAGDALAELDERARALDDPRVRLWNIPRPAYPEGLARWGLLAVEARNYGMEVATGDWLSLLDDDDALEPDNFAFLLALAERTGADFAYGMSDTFKNGVRTGQLYGGWPPGDGQVTHGAFVLRRSLGYRYRSDCYDRGRNADADLWTRLFADGVRCAFAPRIVHHYHRNYP